MDSPMMSLTIRALALEPPNASLLKRFWGVLQPAAQLPRGSPQMSPQWQGSLHRTERRPPTTEADAEMEMV